MVELTPAEMAMPQTLDFVRNSGEWRNVHIAWLEIFPEGEK